VTWEEVIDEIVKLRAELARQAKQPLNPHIGSEQSSSEIINLMTALLLRPTMLRSPIG
jgi:hypothetical protein